MPTQPKNFRSGLSTGQVIRANGSIDYTLEARLGAGRFGEVFTCLMKDADQLDESVPHKVAVVKIQNNQRYWLRERDTMSYLGMPIHDGRSEYSRRSEEDKHNIVKLLGWFHFSDVYGLVMEHMDGDLWRLLCSQPSQRFPLEIVSSVAMQLLTALDWLKTKEVIHADLKHDNVLFNLRKNKVLRVKLADFGWAFTRQNVPEYVGREIQAKPFRAPEIHLGAPFTEAIDMWSLGIMCGMMVYGMDCSLFTFYNTLDSLQVWSWMYGEIPSKVLNAGMHTEKYYEKIADGEFIFKNEFNNRPSKNRFISILNDLNQALPVAGDDFGDFLSRCLDVNPEERLKPNQGLKMAFVKMFRSKMPRRIQSVSNKSGRLSLFSPRSTDYGVRRTANEAAKLRVSTVTICDGMSTEVLDTSSYTCCTSAGNY